MSDVTCILSAIEQGDPSAAEQLLPLVYDELRRLAAQKLAHEMPDQTLQATALVHEAYLRLVGSDREQHWDSRGHFFAAAAEAMRRILIDNARRKQAERHGGGWQRQELHAWNRLAQVTLSSSTIVYTYDALGRRLTESGGLGRDLYYSKDWQVLEERLGGLMQYQQVWSPVYVDALVLRDGGRRQQSHQPRRLPQRRHRARPTTCTTTKQVAARGTLTACF
jgi:RNA polymerase sigma factor (TIGR02999 family)